MTTRRVAVCATVACAAVALCSYWFRGRVHAQGAALEYTIRMIEYSAKGPEGEAVEARRADGSTVSVYRNYGSRGHAFDERTVVDVARGHRLFVREFLNATQTYRIRPGSLLARQAARPTPESNCERNSEGHGAWISNTRLGVERVAGYDAVIFGDTGARTWVAPALGCAVIRSEHRFGGVPGQPDFVSRHEPASIEVGPPDPQLFLPVGDELKPSDAYRRQIHLWHMDEDQMLRENAARLAQADAEYLAAR